MGRDYAAVNDPRYHSLQLHREFKGRYMKNKENMVLMATTWNLWKMRNDMLFNNGEEDASSLLFHIKLVSWLWLVVESKRHKVCSFYEWCTCPVDFLNY